MFCSKSLFRGLSYSPILWLGLFAMPCTAKVSPTTLENMQAAYNGEKNAHVRYWAFAQRADAEGYGEVASLFRAAARAEEIHANNHADVIMEFGVLPQAHLESPVVKSTRENLIAAIKGESYERDTMYPEFLKQARQEGNKNAIKSLNFARNAEIEHARLYVSTLLKLGSLKGTKQEAFYVCPVCGYTAREAEFAKCPTCFTRQERFEKIV